MTQPNLNDSPRKLQFEFQGKPYSVLCLFPDAEIKVASEVLDKTFHDMEEQYELQCEGSPSAPDTNTWLLMGALNLAHRVVCLEREAALQTRDLEEILSKQLDDALNNSIPGDVATDSDRSLPME